MKKFKILQAVYDLRQNTLERFIGCVLFSVTGAFPNILQYVRNRQPRHHATNSGIDQFQHIHSAPAVQHGDRPVCALGDGSDACRHQRFFKLQIAKMVVLIIE